MATKLYLTPHFRRFRYVGIRKITNATALDEKPQELSHVPVMSKEVLRALDIRDNQTFVDFTFGAGGHTKGILKSAQNVRVYGVDRDPVAYEKASVLSQEYPDRLVPLLGRFSEAEALLSKHGVRSNSVDGAVIDCGCSSMQFDDPSRGFALSKDGPLDMRMDAKRYPNEPSAADVVNSLDAASLARIFKVYGEEKMAKKIAQAIVDARFMMRRIDTTQELADLVCAALGEDYKQEDKLRRPTHPATKVFMALRIFVNNELNELNHVLHVAWRILKPGGCLAVLSFHSLEDRIVKRHFQGIDIDEPVSGSIAQKYRNSAVWHSREEMMAERRRIWQPVGLPQPMLPSAKEVDSNPRSRSAKLRVAEKVEGGCVEKNQILR